MLAFSRSPTQVYAIDESRCTGTRQDTEAAAQEYENQMRALPATTLPRARDGTEAKGAL